jgi:sec-independent protein translocase protein TatA
LQSVKIINQLRIMTLNGILAWMLGTGEIIAIVLVVLLLFGGRKIPELMRGLGKGVKSFKQGMNEIEEEIKKPLDDLDKKDE